MKSIKNPNMADHPAAEKVSTQQLRDWHRANDYARVIESLSENADSLHPEQKLLLGLCLCMSGELQRGQAMLLPDVTDEPRNPEWRSDLALAAILRGDIANAATELEAITGSGSACAVDFSRLAAVRLSQDREEEAAALYREAIEREPGREHWYHNLAGVLVRLQRLEEALEQYEAALRIAPDFSNSQHGRHQLLNALERSAEVVDELEQELDKTPADYRLRQRLARALLRDDRFTEAISCLGGGLVKFDELMQLREEDLDSYRESLPAQTSLRLQLAEFWSSRSRHKRSFEILKRTESLQLDESTNIRCLQAIALMEMHQAEAAEALLDSMEEAEENNPRLGLLRAQLHSEQGRYAEAETQLRELLTLYPGNSAILGHLGQTLLWTGQVREAASCFEQASRLNPMALAQMVRARQLPDSPDAIEQMEKIANNRLMAEEARASMAFALAEVFDRRGDNDKSFDALSSANALIAGQLSYHPGAFSNWVDRNIKVFTAGYFQQLPAIRTSDRTPVFVVGMPRSGTTLTEQILAAHPEVFGAGELELIPNTGRLMRKVLHTHQAYPECAEELSTVLREEAARYYLHGLQQHDADSPVVVDKLPHNFVNLGLIASIFPGARIIHLCRDPRDIALSNFQQNFKARHGGMGFAFELEHIAGQLNEHHRLMKHWRAVLPIPMLEIRYEDLVQDQEAVCRQMLDYIGLEWDAAVLAHEKLERPVRTASVSQVREPIYQSSVGKWQRYEQQLEPLLKALDPAVTLEWKG